MQLSSRLPSFRMACLALACGGGLAHADDLWQIDSSTSIPGGPPLTHSQSQCMPREGMDPTSALPGMGNCNFLQKHGTAAAMTFVLECRLPGMPADMSAIRVSGDARLAGSQFDMRYTIDMAQGSGAPGSDLTMTGSVVAHRTGPCAPR